MPYSIHIRGHSKGSKLAVLIVKESTIFGHVSI